MGYISYSISIFFYQKMFKIYGVTDTKKNNKNSHDNHDESVHPHETPIDVEIRD